jgi:hypothetical protein
LRKTALALLIAVVLIALTLFLGVSRQHRDLSKRLADDVIERCQPRARPIHREPALDAGTFEECVGPLVDVAMADAAEHDGGSLRADAPGTDTLSDVLEGKGRVDRMDPGVIADLARLRANTEAQLDCARAPAVGTAPGLGPFAEWYGPKQFGSQWGTLSKVARFEVRRELSAGYPTRSLRVCSDFLALYRDVAWDRGLVGMLLYAAQVRNAVPACVDAVRSAREDELHNLVNELRLIRLGTPSFKWVMETERAQMQLMLFGRFMTDEDRERLPAGAQRLADSENPSRLVDRVLVWANWSYFAGRADQLVAAADSPNRDLRLDQTARPGLLERLGAMEPHSMTPFAHRYDAIGRGLDLLETAARLRLGEPPLPGVTASDATVWVPWTDDEVLSVAR